MLRPPWCRTRLARYRRAEVKVGPRLDGPPTCAWRAARRGARHAANAAEIRLISACIAPERAPLRRGTAYTVLYGRHLGARRRRARRPQVRSRWHDSVGCRAVHEPTTRRCAELGRGRITGSSADAGCG